MKNNLEILDEIAFAIILVCWFSNIKLSNNVFIKTSKASKINANIYAGMNMRSNIKSKKINKHNNDGTWNHRKFYHFYEPYE